MRQDGFEDDIRPDVANESFARLIKPPDYPDDPTEVEITWAEISKDLPVLRRQIARIALQYAGSDAELRARVTSSLVGLYSILRDAAAISSFQEQLDTLGVSSLPKEPFDQDAA